MPNYENSQALNRYSYVYGNPLRYNDPSGHCPPIEDCLKDVVLGTGDVVHKLNEYREDIFFPGPDTSPWERLEASAVIGGGSTLIAGFALWHAPVPITYAAIGEASGALGNMGGQTINGMVVDGKSFVDSVQSIDPADVVIAGGVGFVTGGLAPVPGIGTTTKGNILLGGWANSTQYLVSQKVHGEEVDYVNLAINATVGGLTSGILGPVPVSDPGVMEFGKPLLVNGQTSMADAAHRQLIAVQTKAALSNIGLARTVTGATATNIDWRGLYNNIQ